MKDRYRLSLGGLQVEWEDPGSDGAQRADGAVLQVGGDLDGVSVPVLDQALRTLYDAGCEKVVIDLTALTFVDSSGLGALVGAWRAWQAGGRALLVCNPSGMVRDLLALTGIDRYLLAGAQ